MSPRTPTLRLKKAIAPPPRSTASLFAIGGREIAGFGQHRPQHADSAGDVRLEAVPRTDRDAGDRVAHRASSPCARSGSHLFGKNSGDQPRVALDAENPPPIQPPATPTVGLVWVHRRLKVAPTNGETNQSARAGDGTASSVSAPTTASVSVRTGFLLD